MIVELLFSRRIHDYLERSDIYPYFEKRTVFYPCIHTVVDGHVESVKEFEGGYADEREALLEAENLAHVKSQCLFHVDVRVGRLTELYDTTLCATTSSGDAVLDDAEHSRVIHLPEDFRYGTSRDDDRLIWDAILSDYTRFAYDGDSVAGTVSDRILLGGTPYIGILVPRERRNVYAPATGRLASLAADLGHAVTFATISMPKSSKGGDHNA